MRDADHAVPLPGADRAERAADRAAGPDSGGTAGLCWDCLPAGHYQYNGREYLVHAERHPVPQRRLGLAIPARDPSALDRVHDAGGSDRHCGDDGRRDR